MFFLNAYNAAGSMLESKEAKAKAEDVAGAEAEAKAMCKDLDDASYVNVVEHNAQGSQKWLMTITNKNGKPAKTDSA